MKPIIVVGIIVLILIICVVGFVVLLSTATPTNTEDDLPPPPPADTPCVLPNNLTNGVVIADPVTQAVYLIKDCKKSQYTYPSYVAAGSPHAWIQSSEIMAAIPVGPTI